MNYNLFSILGFTFLSLFMNECANAQGGKTNNNTTTPQSPTAKELWVDSVYQTLNNQEKIGQLFMVAAYSDGPNYNKELISSLINKHQIGGIIFMQGIAEKQITLTNEYQQKAQVPLLIGMDAEWGLGMRLRGVKNYPRQMLLGATRDFNLVKQMGAEIAEQCKRVGAHVDFAPDIDVNNNPANPVINFRSFGEDKEWVSKLGIAYMQGLQENGIMASAKHFPGHGDVSVDSHLDLPLIPKSKEELVKTELYPFKRLIGAGVQSVMISHLSVPALDSTPRLPATLSEKVVTGLLKKEMGFDGLVFTDALNMGGVTKYFPNGETDLLAFLAGNDVLLFSVDVPLAIKKIESVLESGRTNWSAIEKSVKKILAAKYEAGLNNFKPLIAENATQDLNKKIDAFWEQASTKSITLAKDKNNLLKKLNTNNAKIAYINMGVGEKASDMEQKLTKVFPSLKKIPSTANTETYDAVIVNIHNLSLYPGAGGRYGLSTNQTIALKKLSDKQNVIFLIMGNPYVMKYFCDAGTVLTTYENNSYTENAATAVLSGKLEAKGVLSVSACN